MSLLSTWSVNIFFILSGFLITYIISRNIVRNGYFRWQDYMISRIARIYPPLIASIILTVLLYWIITYFNMHGKYSFRLETDLYVIRDSFSMSYREILDSLLMRGGLLLVNGALWSLYVEFKIYIIAMLVAMLAKGRGGWLVKLIALVAVYYVGMGLKGSMIFVAIWGLGSAFFILRNKKVALTSGVAIVFYALTFGISLYYSFTSPRTFLQGDNTINGFIATLALSLLVSAVIFVWETGARFLYPFSPSAKYSYTLYIIHFPLLLFAFSLTHETLSSSFNYARLFIVCALVFVVILCFVYLLARYVEDKKRFEGYIRDGIGEAF
jgi:peptidoglycan/LPS O-acetylase OafA/YrhL